MSKLDVYRLYDCPFPKVRVGKNNDGGYVIADLGTGAYDMFLSAGVDNDVSFEEQFLKAHPSIGCVAYDGTIGANWPKTDAPITFKNENITKSNNMGTYLDAHDNVFIKMDIEFWEYEWILSLSDEQLQAIKQIVLEVHIPSTEMHYEALRRLMSTHVCIHMHANNCLSATTLEDKRVPQVFELTCLRRDLVPTPTPNKTPCPMAIDQVNLPQYDDHTPFDEYPFVW